MQQTLGASKALGVQRDRGGIEARFGYCPKRSFIPLFCLAKQCVIRQFEVRHSHSFSTFRCLLGTRRWRGKEDSIHHICTSVFSPTRNKVDLAAFRFLPVSSMSKVTTLIFDVDDTLYDVGTGFTAHRNGDCVQQYMVDHLNFPSLQAAKELRDQYFAKYHATAKALTVAHAEGEFQEGAPNLKPSS